jgi:hypothetical protein
LGLINQLNPVMYDWIDHDIHDFPDGTHLGFIAQDLQNALINTKYVDSVIHSNQITRSDGTTEPYLGLRETSLIPLLTKAIQELDSKLEQLRKDFDDYRESHK